MATKTIKFTDKDPRAGQITRLDEAAAQKLIDSGNATEVSEQDAAGSNEQAERDAAKRVGGDGDEAARQLQRNADAQKAQQTAAAGTASPAPSGSTTAQPGGTGGEQR